LAAVAFSQELNICTDTASRVLASIASRAAIVRSEPASA
jgi:hypothetical protein